MRVAGGSESTGIDGLSLTRLRAVESWRARAWLRACARVIIGALESGFAEAVKT